MSAHSLVIQYSTSAGPVVEDGYWLRLEQDPLVDDIATGADASRLIDAVFQVEPCNDDTEAVVEKVDSIKAGVATGTIDANEIVTAVAESVLDLAICSQENDGSVEVEIKVILSHPDEPYQLRISGGEAVETTLVETEITQAITVENATSHSLEYPVIAGFSAGWAGNVVAAAGQPPVLGRTGNTLHWSGSATGTINCSYLTRYALVKVKVFGVDGEQGSALVRCFYHGLVEEMEPELPKPAEVDRSPCGPGNSRLELPEERVTCYKTIVVHKRCSCSEIEVDWYSYDEVVPCPDWAPVNCPGTVTDCMHQLGTEGVTEYVHCAADGDSYDDPDFYELHCCTKRTGGLPACKIEKRTWRGGAPIVSGVEYYRQVYGKAARIVPVSPNGGICGEWTIRQMVSAANCCDFVGPVRLPVDMVAAPGSLFEVRAADGLGPLRWTAGSHLQIEAVSADTYTAWIRADADFCGHTTIDVTDDCGTEAQSSVVRSTVGAWRQIVWPNSCELPPGFAPGPADDPGPTDLCGGFTLPNTRTSGRYRVTVGFQVRGFSDKCPEIACSAGAISMFSGLGLSPEAAQCMRYSCYGQNTTISGGCCTMYLPSSPAQYAMYYQVIQGVQEWQC